MAMGRMLVEDSELHYQGVDGDGPCVIAHQQGGARGWHVLQPDPVRAPVILVQRLYHWQKKLLGQLGVEPELVDLVVPHQPAPGKLEEVPLTLCREGADPLWPRRRLVDAA